jgi:hypothetical protein
MQGRGPDAATVGEAWGKGGGVTRAQGDVRYSIGHEGIIRPQTSEVFRDLGGLLMKDSSARLPVLEPHLRLQSR